MRGIAFLLPLLVLGCEKLEVGPDMTEKAKVCQLIYTPSQHGSTIAPGVDTKGKVNITFVSVDIPEKYAVVFECQHGKFIIEDEGKESRAHRLWSRLKDGQEVTVRYAEVYSVDGNGGRHLKKYNFIGAE